MKYIERKDCSPQETVSRIKSIFVKLGIKTEIVEEHHWGDLSYSLRVELAAFPGIGANGKGVTRDLALASAYGELMERLENRALIHHFFIRKIPKDSIQIDDMLLESNGAILSTVPKSVLYCLFHESPTLFNMEPFYCINTKNIVELPTKLLDLVNGTNGLCAGNSFYEAVTQGLGEICERFILKQLYFEGETFSKSIRIIPESAYNWLSVYTIIEEFGKNAFKCKLLDFTYCGKFPVLGLLLLDEKKHTYRFSIASDINFEIALQRCITEMLQGKSMDLLFKISMNPLIDVSQLVEDIYELKNADFHFQKSVTTGDGLLPPYLFLLDEYCQEETIPKPFSTEINENKIAYECMIQLITHEGYTIYIQDNSFLGFPAYRIYVPQMSELYDAKLTFEMRALRIQCVNLVEKLRNQNIRYQVDVLSQLANQLDILLSHQYYTGGLSDLYGLIVSSEVKNNVLVDTLFLEIVINYHLGNNERCYLLYKNHFAFKNKNDPIALLLALKKLKWSEKLTDKIKNMYGINSEEENFKLNFPTCPECDECELLPYCKFNDWKKLLDKLDLIRASFVSSLGKYN